MGLLNLLNDSVDNFKFYLSKGYTGNGEEPGMKSLKFGKDRPGGGDSGQPYIKEPILDNPLPESPDFLLRGGLNAPVDAAQDVARLTKYMFDLKSPSGLLFTAKQNILSRTAVKTEKSGILNEGIYTPLSTLAQAGIGFLGGHVEKQDFLFPKKYENIVYQKNLVDANRLVKYYNTIQNTKSDSTTITSYPGGPQSILGIGKTHIEFAKDGNGAPLRTGINNANLPKDFTTNFGYNNYSVFKNPRPTSWDGARIFNGNTVSGIYQNLTGVDPLEAKYSTTNNSTNLQLFSNSTSPFAKSGYISPLTSGSNPSPSQLYAYVGDRNYALYNHGTGSAHYVSPINKILNNSGKASRQLLSDPKYDINVGTFTPQSFDNQTIPGYFFTSSKIISRDESVSGSSNLWKDYNTYYGFGTGLNQHKDGYLADLDKNAGYSLNDQNQLISYNNAYPGGIAPDFRLVPRESRGFPSLNSSGKPTNEQLDQISGPLSTGEISKTKQEPSTRWMTENNKLSEKTLDLIYYYGSSNKSSFRTSKNTYDGENDILPFQISIIDPTTTDVAQYIPFRAYIDNFSDTYNADWKSQTYMGRAEKFYKYNSFDRSISLGFTVAAESPEMLDSIYANLNSLVSSLAPTYTTYGYMAGNMHKLTVGNYVNNQVGIIDGLTLDIIEESPWDLDKQLPFYIKVSGMKFIPIQTHRPQYGGTFINGSNL